MADWAHRKVDEILEEIDERLEAEYIQTQKQVDKEFSDYIKQFEDEREQKLQELAKAAFAIWVTARVMSGRKWTNARDKIANTYVKGNQRAASVVNSYTGGVFVLNRNFMSAIVEKVTGRSGIFGKFTTDNLKRISNKRELWRKANIYVPKDQRWHKQKIKSAIRKGIESGESIPKITQRLQNITNMDYNAAKRTARTAVTGAQNAGRMQAFREAEKAGIECMKEWIATMDNRTRESHAEINGETVPIEEEFSNGLMYPGDADGAPEEVYNCRCTLGSYIDGDSDSEYRDDFDESDYEEWLDEYDEDTDYTEYYDGEEINEYFYNDSSYEEWESELTEDESDAISWFIGNGYSDINGYLRDTGYDESNIDEIENAKKSIDSAISKFNLKDGIIVQRGLNDFYGESIVEDFNWNDIREIIGKTYLDKGYGSSTVLIGNRVAVSKPVLFEIEVPGGIGRGAYINKFGGNNEDVEYEFLLARNSKYTITDVAINDEMIPPQIIVKMRMK